MANFSPTNLVKAQALLNKKYQAPENRMKVSPAVALGLMNQDFLIPGAADLRKREDRAVEANILKRSKRASGSARTHNHTGNRGDSFVLALSWATFSDPFSISLKQMDNNAFAFEQALAQQFENSMKNIIEDIETDQVTYLQAQRTQINAATQGGSFNGANDAFEISTANQFFQTIKSMMRQNNYRDELDVILNPLGFIDAEYQKAQGAGNNANLTFQFNGMNIAESIELADANYTTGALGLIMPKGSFALLPWIPPVNRRGEGDYMSYVGGFGVMQDPWGLGITFAVHGYAERADASGSNGSSQDVVMQFELSVDMASCLSPVSVATESVVFEVAKV
ncbi:MAG TPA: hypothetical protein VGF79_00860 [Bacteroidia bacterium]